MTRLLQELKRKEAMERAERLGERAEERESELAEPLRPAGQGPLARARVQGQHRWYVQGRWIRTGETIDVFVGGAWVSGRFDWRGTPTGLPSIFLTVGDPDAPERDTGLTLRLELAEGVIARFG